jgi:threonine/homoserine/homoserine lactone efflux protein
MNAWIAAISSRSFRGGIITGLGAMTADGLLGAAVYLLDRLVDLPAVVRYVYVVGAGIMAFLAWRLLSREPDTETAAGGSGTFLRALGLGLTNPFQAVWWLTAGVAFAYLGGAVLLVGLFAAIAVWIVVFPWAVHAGTQRRPALARAVRYASGAILVGFAIYFAVLFVVA